MTIEEAQDKLKPCPFCGGNAKTIRYILHELFAPNYGVYCCECGANIRPMYKSIEEAIEAWNRRKNNDD